MITRITEEQAKYYVPCKEDYAYGGFKDARYYTLTPNEDGWDYVKYYSKLKWTRYEERDDDYDSWVYILGNPLHQNDILKIGHTKHLPDVRAKQISRSTGVALEFEVVFAFNCWNGEGLEKEIHKYLDQYRIRNEREFFKIELVDAIEAIQFLGKRYRKA